MRDENFLSRWARRKKASKEEHALPTANVLAEPAPVVVKPGAGTQLPEPLPPVESLTYESDFTAFMKPEVEPGLRRQALKTLLQDPRFNVMDGLDVYIDDYSKPDPLPEGWLEKMNQVKRLGIFDEPSEEPQPEPAAQVEAMEKPAEEQPVAPPAKPDPPDTSGAENPPSPMRESH